MTNKYITRVNSLSVEKDREREREKRSAVIHRGTLRHFHHCPTKRGKIE